MNFLVELVAHVKGHLGKVADVVELERNLHGAAAAGHVPPADPRRHWNGKFNPNVS